MMQESAIIKTFLIERPKQTKIFEVRLPRGAENIIGVELGFSLIEGVLLESGIGILDDPGRAGIGRSPIAFGMRRNLCVGELRLQNFSKANLFYAGELSLDRNSDIADFTTSYFPPKVFTHQAHAFETEVKLTAKNRIIRGIFRDQLWQSVPEGYKYKVSVYLWTSKVEKEKK